MRRPLDLVPPQEVARALEVSVDTLARWRTRGEGPAFVKVGRRVWYRWVAVDHWIKRSERGGR